MKRTVSILLALALVLGFNLVATTPVAADAGYRIVDDDGKGWIDIDTGAHDCDSTAMSVVTTIAAGIAATPAGGTLFVCPGTYSEGQIVINKDITIIGASSKPVISPIANLPANNNAGSEWILVSPNITFNLRNVVLDGSTFVVQQAIRNHGSTIVDSVDFLNIKSTGYHAMAIVSFGGTIPGGMGKDSHGSGGAASNVIVTGCTFQQIGRIGVLVKGSASTAQVSNCTYTGRGTGDWLDYGIEVGAGGQATITGNTITNCVNSTTAWGSAGILVTDAYGPGSAATITGNTLTGNTEGIAVGYIQPHHPTDWSVVTANYNNIFGNTAAGIDQVGNVTVDGRYNWWGANDGPDTVGPGSGDKVSANVNYDSWTTKDATATGSGNASFTPSAGNITAGVSAVAEGSLPPAAQATKPISFPDGLFSFNITGLSPGAMVTVTITLPPGAAPTQYWKYHASEGGWIQIPMTVVGPPNVITITLVDGGLGDDDGLANGTIVDQGGPGSGAVGWETYPISKVRVLLPWIALGAAIAAGLSLLVLRRRRIQT